MSKLFTNVNFNFQCVHSLHGFFRVRALRAIPSHGSFCNFMPQVFSNILVFSFFASLFVGVEKMFRIFYDCACFKMHVEVLFFRPFQQFLLLLILLSKTLKCNEFVSLFWRGENCFQSACHLRSTAFQGHQLNHI